MTPKINTPARFALALAAALAIFSGRSIPAATPPVLLVSMDGFRWDYCALHPAETPHLRRYAAEGISARELIPVYPSNTFPNHYSIATGLYPARHGMINNDFFDPRLGRFDYSLRACNQAPQWWGGEPIWVTAEKQGRESATYYWVGSEAPIEGRRPNFSIGFDSVEYKRTPFESRIATVVGWLSLPPDRRPSVITFYIEETNSVGHKYGPESPELVATLKRLDGELGALMDRLKAGHFPVNLIVVSDHGMTSVSPNQVMLLDDYLDLGTVQVDFEGPAMGLRPLKGTPRDLVRALARLPHAKAYLTDNQPSDSGLRGLLHRLDLRLFHEADYLPARFHLAGNPRIPDVWIVPEEGWHMETRAHFEVPAAHDQQGDHGFDPIFRSMHGILIADGPSFKTGGEVIGPVENIHIYNLMCALLHLAPAPNDGDDRLVRAFLR